MTREDLLEKVVYDKRSGVFGMKSFSSAFKRLVDLWIFTDIDDKENQITDKTVERVNGFLLLTEANIDDIKIHLWSEYNNCVSAIDYGFVPQALIDKHLGDTEKANRDYFGYSNPDDCFDKSEVSYVLFSDVPNKVDIIFQIYFKVPWENEHGVIMTFLNGKIIDVH